jgi:hypothetical protein
MRPNQARDLLIKWTSENVRVCSGSAAWYTESMPTKVSETLYAPEYTKNQLAPVLKIVIPVLEETLLHGLMLFDRYANRGEAGNDDDLVILFIFRHLLELFDSVKIQIAECSAAPAALQLRAMFEALLALEYLTEDKAKTGERAIAYRFKVQRHRKQFYLSQDPNTVEGKELRAFIAHSPYAAELKTPDLKDLTDRLREIDKILETKEYVDTAKAYKKAEKKIRYPCWYSLHGGPTSTMKLAHYLKHADWYQLLYSEWSDRSHAGDVIDRILTHNADGAAARALRDSREFNSTVDFAMVFAFDAMCALIRYYRPSDEVEHSGWYLREISPVKIPTVVVISNDGPRPG